MAYARNFWWFLFWNFLCGLAVPFADIPMSTYMGLSVPDGYLGRVNSVLNMVSTGVMPLGTALGGMLIAGVGIQAGFIAMGVGCCLACAIGILDRSFRSVRMPEPVAVTA
jgi:MFS family permease